MKRIKSLKPSLREKKRYLVYEAISDKPLTKPITETIWTACLQYLGEQDMAKAGMISLDDKYDPRTQKGILRINHKEVDGVKTALLLITKADNKDVIVQPRGVSGILKKAIQKHM